MEVDNIAVMIPIFGIVFGIGIAAVAIVTRHRQELQRNELRHKERLAALEKGIELPPDPVIDNGTGARRGNLLRSGLTALFVGVVLYIAIDRLAGDEIALFALVPAAVGLASLLVWYIEGRKKSDGNGGAISK